MKPLLVGEAPSKNEITERPLGGRVGRRLAAFCGLSYDAYLEHFERVNLLHVRQDTAEKGFTFDVVAAGHAAHELYLGGAITPDRIVLLLGRRVAEAFVEMVPYFEPHVTSRNTHIYVLPHPSGINRWYNDPANRERMEKFMRGIVTRTTVEVVHV